MPRPSLERTLKYLPVVPRAQTKLGREARRESHDLRKLVGHANLLDTLMEKLDFETAEEEGKAEMKEVEPAKSTAKFVADERGYVAWNKIDFEDDGQCDAAYSDSSEDEDELITPEFDDENNEEHTLGRTVSRRDGVPAVEAPVQTVPQITPEAQHPIFVSNRLVESDGESDEMNEVDRQIQAAGYDSSEDYFSDKNIPKERAKVTASLAAFDVGATVSTVGS